MNTTKPKTDINRLLQLGCDLKPHSPDQYITALQEKPSILQDDSLLNLKNTLLKIENFQNTFDAL